MSSCSRREICAMRAFASTQTRLWPSSSLSSSWCFVIVSTWDFLDDAVIAQSEETRQYYLCVTLTHQSYHHRAEEKYAGKLRMLLKFCEEVFLNAQNFKGHGFRFRAL